MSNIENKQETTELTDLEVREVSLVDNPANQRKFLVIKRDDSGDETMPESKTTDVVDTLIEDVEKVNKKDPETKKVTEPQDPEKVLTVGIEKLMAFVADIRDREELSEPVVKAIDAITSSISELPLVEKAVEPDENKLDQAVATLDTLVKLGEHVKGLEDKSTIPAELVTKLETISFEVPKEEVQEQLCFEVYKSIKQEDDPTIIMKVGSKMKKTRLSLLRSATKVLMELLKELDPEFQVDGAHHKGKGKVKKEQPDEGNKEIIVEEDVKKELMEEITQAVTEQISKAFEEKLGEEFDKKLDEKLTELMTSKLEEVNKRVEELEKVSKAYEESIHHLAALLEDLPESNRPQSMVDEFKGRKISARL